MPTTVEQGDLAEVLRLYDELVTETRKEDGCINYELLQRTDNPCELVLVEEWESQEHLDAHTHTEHFVRLVEALAKLGRQRRRRSSRRFCSGGVRSQCSLRRRMNIPESLECQLGDPFRHAETGLHRHARIIVGPSSPL
ncbi:putative quinol monooxygenase [Rhodococcus sp. 3Y1]